MLESDVQTYICFFVFAEDSRSESSLVSTRQFRTSRRYCADLWASEVPFGLFL